MPTTCGLGRRPHDRRVDSLAATTPLGRDELVGDDPADVRPPAAAVRLCRRRRPAPLATGRRAGTHAVRRRRLPPHTHLDDDWLAADRWPAGLKRQLILQGVPGTGKTHVARCLARLLTGGRDDAVRLVQFHPAYSYEEFVEGIKVRACEVDGRHDVTYPVEDGLLCAFAAEAARAAGPSRTC